MGKDRQESIRLFRYAWLERLTMVSLRTFIITWAVLLAMIFWAAQGTARQTAALGLFMAGLLVWSLTEYALHRFLFHWKPRWAPLAHLIFIVHENHHTAPGDPMRNLMPPLVSMTVGGLIWAGCVAIIGPAGTWLFGGFISAYVGYDLVHYGCHQWPLTDRLSGRFKAHHMRHHHARVSGNYAITGMIWDRLFGTRITSLKD